MISYKIHLLRCGRVAESSEQLYVGQLDLPLSSGGRAELECLQKASGYPQIERLYASPLIRCVQTAEALYPGHTPRPVTGLMDMGLGEFEGKSLEQLKDLPEFGAWLQNSQTNPPPGGELAEDFTARVSGTFNKIVLEMMRERVQSAALITHGGVIMTLMAAVALPRLHLHQWAVDAGCGYTLLTSAQLWMQGGCAEAFAAIPPAQALD